MPDTSVLSFLVPKAAPNVVSFPCLHLGEVDHLIVADFYVVVHQQTIPPLYRAVQSCTESQTL